MGSNWGDRWGIRWVDRQGEQKGRQTGGADGETDGGGGGGYYTYPPGEVPTKYKYTPLSLNRYFRMLKNSLENQTDLWKVTRAVRNHTVPKLI